MSSRFLVWILFGLWSLICWRWYVCGIKEACSSEKAVASVSGTPATAVPVPLDTTTASPSAETAGNQPEKPQESSTSGSIESVQVIETGDDAEIHFPYNSTDKEENASIDAYLSKLASQLAEGNRTVTITGHTDNIGDAKTNLAFAERRAKNIRDILKTKGVKHDQIKCVSYGETKPIATNDTPEGRYQNRRVEIKIDN